MGKHDRAKEKEMKRMNESKMNYEDKELYNKIDEILWLDWDPIGVNEFNEARDVYYTYIPMMYNLKKSGADVDSIANQLHFIETKTIGLSGNIDHCMEVAKKIKNL
jgi:hypothetical protein